MQTGSGSGAALPYYDRSATRVTEHYRAGLAGFGRTERINYVVPAGRRAFIDSIVFWADISTLGVSGDAVVFELEYIPDGEAAVTVFLRTRLMYLLGDTLELQVNNFGFLSAGDEIKGYSVYTETGSGIVNWSADFSITEFDA